MERIKSILNSIWNFIVNNYAKILIVLLIIVFTVFCYKIYNKVEEVVNHQKEVKQETIMTPQQATDSNYLRNTKDMSKDDAQKAVVIIEKAQSGQIQPAGTVIVQAPSAEKATEIVKEKIQEKDPSMPPEAFEKTDRTIIAEQPDNKDYQVGVYKINLSKRWSVGTGVGVNDGDMYIPISAERLYKNNRSLEFQVNVDAGTARPNGGQILHKWYF